MFRLQENKKLINILTVIALVGEMPLAAASQLGSHEAYRKMFYELEKKQVYENTKNKKQMCVKLINMSDKGKLRRCRLFKKAIPILDWLGLKRYYEETFPNNRVSGGEQNRFRNDMIAESVMMMLEANIQVVPTKLPMLRLNNRFDSFNGQSCFYTTRHIKKTLNKGINKILSSRVVGALFAGNNVYAVYNTRSSVIKWKGMNELKTRLILTDLARINADVSECDSAIIFGKDDKTILNSFFNNAEFKDKDFRFDKIYNNVYAIPQSLRGIEMLQFFKIPNFQEKILAYMFEKNNRSINSGYGWHAVVNGEYVYSYLDSNIAALSRFYETAKRGKGKKKFMVICYDFQEKFIKELFEGIASVATIPFQIIVDEIGGIY